MKPKEKARIQHYADSMKSVWINGTERLLDAKDQHGMYHAYLDDGDIKWLNRVHKQKLRRRTMGKSEIPILTARDIDLITDNTVDKTLREVKNVIDRAELFCVYYTDNEIKKGFKIVKMPARIWLELKQKLEKIE